MKRAHVVFLDVGFVESIHDEQLALGGLPGLRDAGLLASAVAAPEQGYYFTLATLATVYAYGLAKNHAFLDANKRTALFVAAAFLRANGFPLVLGKEAEDLMVDVAAGLKSRDDLREFFARAMGGDVDVLDE